MVYLSITLQFKLARNVYFYIIGKIYAVKICEFVQRIFIYASSKINVHALAEMKLSS
jgi:hypothetical protein